MNRNNSKVPLNVAPPELVIGLVAPVGVDLHHVGDQFATELKRVGYQLRLVRLSSLMAALKGKRKLIAIKPEDERIAALQREGNQLRKRFGRGDALAGLAIEEIAMNRPVDGHRGAPLPATVSLLRSLKHPEEVTTLRRIYGSAFLLVGVSLPRTLRVDALAHSIAQSRNQVSGSPFRARAEQLVTDDENQPRDRFGQKISETFPQSDVFLDGQDRGQLNAAVKRFIDLLFGAPFETPTIDEYCMSLASVAAMRSADPSRQVGAVIANQSGDVLSVGTNEVPKPGGGLYWAGDDPDRRDFQLETNRVHEMRLSGLQEVIERLQQGPWLGPKYLKLPAAELVNQIVPALAETRLMRGGEYGRTVHAEMAAMLAASRIGVIVQGMTLYTTTYPCQNCFKHAIAAGIRRVVYVDPYPRSFAEFLHPEAQISLVPFHGVGPRIYGELFSSYQRTTSKGIRSASDLLRSPRLPRSTELVSYLTGEALFVKDFRTQRSRLKL